jgi:hypothetical protein
MLVKLNDGVESRDESSGPEGEVLGIKFNLSAFV